MLNVLKYFRKKQGWHFNLQSLEQFLDTQEGFLALDRCVQTLDNDLKNLRKLGFLVAGEEPVDMASAENADYVCRIHKEGGAPSLPAMVVYACDHLGIKEKSFIMPLLMASVLGEIPNEFPYHNNLHFKKVVLQIIRLISLHNYMFRSTKRFLNSRSIALLLIAACIHDFKHDGKGNTLNGLHQRGRLELRSYDLALPYLRRVGFHHQEDLKTLVTLLLATDVSPLGGESSPMRQMKAAWRSHFEEGSIGLGNLRLSEDLRALQTNGGVCDMALLLHEADIATSAGIDYRVTQYETASYFAETGYSEATPQHILNFLNDVCERQFLSAPARRLYSSNMARIYELAEQDVRAGNVPFKTALS